METMKTWVTPKLSVHGDMTKITLRTIAVKRGGANDSLVASLSPWQSCQCRDC